MVNGGIMVNVYCFHLKIKKIGISGQNNKKPNIIPISKTWTQFVENNRIDDDYNRVVRVADAMGCEVDYKFTPIENSALALLKIHQLIKVGYGGNITTDEWRGSNNPIYIILPCSNQEDFFNIHEVYSRTEMGMHHLAFHTYEQAREFLSYPENVQLIKYFNMMKNEND